MTAEFDLIVIGAGPAGASAAVTARRLGLSVALVDKARFPRDKLCGGGITGRCALHLDRVFGSLPEALFLETRVVRLVAGARLLGEVADAPPLRMTMRQGFDAALMARAVAAGAADFTGVRIAGMTLEAGWVALADGRALRGRVLIGADGVNSAVGRALFGRAHDPARIGFGMEVEHRGPVAPVVELDLAAAEWGYGWAFPKPHGVTLGVGGVAARNADMRGAMAGYLARHGVAADQVRMKGHFLPFGDFLAEPGRGAVLLAGDAAGLVDPITGEGIGWAVHSGALAAEAAAEVLRAGAPERALEMYRRRLAPVHRELDRARRLRAVVYHPWLRGRFLTLLARQPRLQQRYLDLLAGKLDYADIRWSALPRLALRMMRGR